MLVLRRDARTLQRTRVVRDQLVGQLGWSRDHDRTRNGCSCGRSRACRARSRAERSGGWAALYPHRDPSPIRIDARGSTATWLVQVKCQNGVDVVMKRSWRIAFAAAASVGLVAGGVGFAPGPGAVVCAGSVRIPSIVARNPAVLFWASPALLPRRAGPARLRSSSGHRGLVSSRPSRHRAGPAVPAHQWCCP
jgi:hypothetical protein